jgi:hypothetical protein
MTDSAAGRQSGAALSFASVNFLAARRRAKHVIHDWETRPGDLAALLDAPQIEQHVDPQSGAAYMQTITAVRESDPGYVRLAVVIKPVHTSGPTSLMALPATASTQLPLASPD